MTGINNEGANNASGLLSLLVVGAATYCFLNLVRRVPVMAVAASMVGPVYARDGVWLHGEFTPHNRPQLADRAVAQQQTAMVPAQTAAVAQDAGAGALTNARVLVMADNPDGGVDIAYQGQHGVGAGHYENGQLDFVYQGEHECNII